MDFTRPVNAAATPRPKGGRWGRRLLFWCVLPLVLLMVLAGMAPTLLSMGWARAVVLRRVNAALAPARVEARDWSLAWFGEQRVEGIVYDDAARGARIRVRTLRLNALWALLPIGKVTAEVAVEAPEVVLTPVEKAAFAPMTPDTSVVSPEPGMRAPFVLPAWDVSAKLRVTEAAVRLSALPEPLLSQGRVELSLPARDKEISVVFSGAVLGAAVNAEALLPSAEELVAATRPADVLRHAHARLDAPWATLEAQARSGRAGEAWPEGSLTARLDLAKVLARARTLGVTVPGVETATGTVDLTASLAPGPAECVKVAVSLDTCDAVAAYEGKRIGFAPRSSVGLAATLDPARPLAATVERLSVSLPGLLASGKGTLAEGTLAAQLEADELLTAFAPFVGGFRLPEPLSVRLDARADNGVLGMTAKARSGGATLADLTLNAEGIDLAAQRVRSAKLGLKADLGGAARFVPLPERQTLAGTFLLSATAAGSPDACAGAFSFALRDVVYRAASWRVSEPCLLEGKAAFALREGVASVSDGSFESPAFALGGDVALRLGCPLARGLTATLKGTVRPGEPLAKWRVWGKDETPLALSGTVALEAKALPRDEGGALPALTLGATSDDFAFTFPRQASSPLPFTLSVAAQDVSSGGFALSHFSLVSPYLEAEGKGTFDTAAQRVAVTGALTPDLAALWALPPLEGARKAGVSVSGRNTRPFAFEAPVGQGVAGILNYGKGTAEVAFDRVTVPGFDIPGGTATATLAEGVAALDGRLTVNGGRMCLNPRVALAVKPYVLTVPDGTKVLEGVALTQEMMDAALRVVNPLLSGAATPQGSLDLVCDTLTLPLGDDPLRGLETRLTLFTHGCGVTPSGLLGSVLRLLHVDDKTAFLPDQSFAVRVDGGRLTCDPIRMRIAAVRLDCSGSTDLATRELDYTLSLPLTQQLLGDRLANRLKVGDTLRLPIRGTLDRPVLDTGPLLGALADSALGRAAERLTDRLGGAIRKGSEAGMEAGGAVGQAAGDLIKATGEAGADAGERLGDALRALFERKKKE